MVDACRGLQSQGGWRGRACHHPCTAGQRARRGRQGPSALPCRPPVPRPQAACLSSLMGTRRQTTASAAPIQTMKRMETAEGMATSTSAKCLVESA